MNPVERDYYSFTVGVASRQRDDIVAHPRPIESVPCQECPRQAWLVDYDIFDRSRSFMCSAGHLRVTEEA